MLFLLRRQVIEPVHELGECRPHPCCHPGISGETATDEIRFFSCSFANILQSLWAVLRPHDFSPIAQLFIYWKRFSDAFKHPLNVNSVSAAFVWLCMSVCYRHNSVIRVI